MKKTFEVCFKDGGKGYFFKTDLELNKDDYVIVETEKGNQFAKVIKEVKVNDIDSQKDILRIATDEDYKTHLKNLKDAEKALNKCREIVEELSLDMKVINAQYTFERNQLLFNFLADDRIDFRELAKKLAAIYHTRIELRQIGARDKAKEIGGIGVCGNTLCCITFLKRLETVSMNMAKNQNLALNPTKINGSCGRLLCCLAYEDEEYKKSLEGMPQIGETVKTKDGEGQVVSLNILQRKYSVLIDGEKVEYEAKNRNSKK